MDLPVCFSQHFVNKQNVRCFANIIDIKLLKTEDKLSLLHNVFEEKSLVSAIPEDLLNILSDMRINFKNRCKDDFRSYFTNNNTSKQHILNYVDKELVFVGSWNILTDIIPWTLFGSHNNTKIFKKAVFTVIESMNRQFFFFSRIIQKWDFSVKPWNNVPGSVCGQILRAVLSWILKYVLCGAICLNFYVTTCKLDGDENKLYFFWKNEWQSFNDRKISQMIFTKVLKRFEPYCLGHRVKRKHSQQDRLKLKMYKKDIPKLYLVLKPNNDCRPIVRYKNGQQSSAEKYKMKERLYFLKVLTGKSYEKIETQFTSLFHSWVDHKKPQLYFVKTDLSNAFGSIVRERLLKILCQRHLDYQKTEKQLYMKKKMAQLYKEIITELRKPLLIRAGSTVYEWTEGLVQGYRYSPALSELYYTHVDEIYFPNHMIKNESKLRLFVRVVDDYLYITDSIEDANMFLEALSNYRNVNYDKTIVNFKHSTLKFCEDITFLGYTYNTTNLQVSRASNIFTGHMCYKITFSNAISNLSKFIDSRIGQSGIQISSHIFNFYHNNEEVVWNHVFTTFCLSANKFCTILALCCDGKEMHNYLSLYKKRVTVKLGNTIIDTLRRNKPEEFMFVYCINHFRYLSMLALSLCAKKTPMCSGLVPFINGEVAKTNCIFGKWREHASRIDKNGVSQCQAMKEVCRRSDLRKIMKSFVVLPNGIQCYNIKNEALNFNNKTN